LTAENLGWELKHISDGNVWRGTSFTEWWAVERAGGGESWAVQNSISKLWDGDPLGWIDFEDPTKNQIQIGRKWKNCPQEAGIFEIGAEGAIALRGAFPWVAATCEVDEDDTKRPDVVGSGSIARRSSRWRLLAFRRHVKGGATAKIRSDWLRGRKTKICKLDLSAVLGDQDILWLEISVVDTERMAILNSIEELQENPLRQDVVAYKVAMLGDVREKVTLWAVLDNDISAVDGMQDLD
jgi:hypothetical protein